MLAAAREHDIVAIMANQYAENPNRLTIEHARKMLTEKKTIYKDRLGRPTQTQVLRDQQIASNIKDMMKNAMTPYKMRPGGVPNATTPLRRSTSQLSMRSEGTSRKKNTRNLMILGSSSSVKNQY